MNLLFALPGFHRYDRGAEVALLAVADAIARGGDAVTVISGVWEGTAGVIKSINQNKQTVTIHVDMFGRETPVELAFTEVRRM